MLRLILYLSCMSLCCAAMVLTVVGYKYKNQAGFPVNLAGMICSLMVLSTSYYLSEFSALLGEKGDYNFAEKSLDLLSTFSLFYFWFRTVHRESPKKHAWIAGQTQYRIWVLCMGIVYLVYAAAYLFFVDDYYHIARYYNAVILLQYLLSFSTAAAILTGLASMGSAAGRGTKGRRTVYILSAGVLILLMALYNGIMSLLIFKGQYDFDRWMGNLEFNGEFQLALGIILLGTAISVCRETLQTEAGASAPSSDSILRLLGEYGLSERERDVALLLYEKLTYEGIGEQLHISKYTVKRHVHNLYEKMGVSKRPDFIRKIDGHL